ALVLREEARQVRARCAGGKHGHQRVLTLLMGTVEGDADLVPDPVHHAVAADIDSKRGAARQGGLQRVLPAASRTEVGLVDPDLEAVGLCLLALLKAPRQAQGSLAVDPGVRKEQKVRTDWCYRRSVHRPDGIVRHRLTLTETRAMLRGKLRIVKRI